MHSQIDAKDVPEITIEDTPDINLLEFLAIIAAKCNVRIDVTDNEILISPSQQANSDEKTRTNQ